MNQKKQLFRPQKKSAKPYDLRIPKSQYPDKGGSYHAAKGFGTANAAYLLGDYAMNGQESGRWGEV